MSDIQDEAYTELCEENKRLKGLLARAADALEGLANVVEARPMHTSAVASRHLIAELRKAAG